MFWEAHGRVRRLGTGDRQALLSMLDEDPADFGQILALHFKLFLLFIAGNRASTDSTSVTLHIPMPRPSGSRTYQYDLISS